MGFRCSGKCTFTLLSIVHLSTTMYTFATTGHSFHYTPLLNLSTTNSLKPRPQHHVNCVKARGLLFRTLQTSKKPASLFIASYRIQQSQAFETTCCELYIQSPCTYSPHKPCMFDSHSRALHRWMASSYAHSL